MGKAYSKELAVLGETYDWAREVSIEPLLEFVEQAHARPLIAIGSGGSTTAAHLAALLHRFNAGAFARHATPLDVVLSEPNLHEATTLLFSASGKHQDILGAFDRCIQYDMHAVATLCTRRGSPLAVEARRFERAYVFEEETPTGKDGFLATNSLLASCALISRAYNAKLPDREFIKPSRKILLDQLHGRTMAVILHGGWGSPAATDLESKLNESALVSAQLSDYRNFGHGRHLGLARRLTETIVITLVTPETSDLADRTRALLPSEIPVVELRTSHEGAAGMVDLLIQGFYLVRSLGELQGFDPGRPTVPAFGRKLYHLTTILPGDDTPAPVKRKLARIAPFRNSEQAQVVAAFSHFIERLGTTQLGGVVLDYDGTLCTRTERFGVLRVEIAGECRRLLEGDIIIGIATGRGRSVRESLQKTLPHCLWDRVIMGYYNGGEIAPLTRDDVPSRDVPLEGSLNAAKDLLEDDFLLQKCALLTARRHQITVELKRRISTDALMSHVMTLLAPLEKQGIRVLASSHSVDVLPVGVGKLAVVDTVQQRVKKGAEVLCIGDRGAWPGNDCALLSHWPSLSVDEVSTSLTTCWNIAPAGVRGADAALRYLQSIHISNDHAIFDSHGFWGRR